MTQVQEERERGDAVRYGDVFGRRGFGELVGLALSSTLGMSLQIYALSVEVYARTGSPAWSGAAFAAGFLPQLVGGTFLTSLADRWPVRRVLAGGALVRALCAGVLALGVLAPAAAIALVAAVAVVQPVASAAQSGAVSRVLPVREYVLGRSVLNLVSSGAQMAGLAAGGAVAAALGVGAAFGVAAGLQVVGVALAFRVPDTARPGVPRSRWSPAETWRANLELLRDVAVRRVLVSWWVPVTLLVGAESLVVAFSAQRHGAGSITGLLLGAFPAGSAVGDLVVGRWVPHRARVRSATALCGVTGICLVPLAWLPAAGAAGLCLLLASAGTAYQLAGQTRFVTAVPDERRSVAFGLYASGLMAGQGLGPLVSGAVADVLGAGRTIALLGAGIVLAAVTVVRGARLSER